MAELTTSIPMSNPDERSEMPYLPSSLDFECFDNNMENDSQDDNSYSEEAENERNERDLYMEAINEPENIPNPQMNEGLENQMQEGDCDYEEDIPPLPPSNNARRLSEISSNRHGDDGYGTVINPPRQSNHTPIENPPKRTTGNIPKNKGMNYKYTSTKHQKKVEGDINNIHSSQGQNDDSYSCYSNGREGDYDNSSRYSSGNNGFGTNSNPRWIEKSKSSRSHGNAQYSTPESNEMERFPEVGQEQVDESVDISMRPRSGSRTSEISKASKVSKVSKLGPNPPITKNQGMRERATTSASNTTKTSTATKHSKKPKVPNNPPVIKEDPIKPEEIVADFQEEGETVENPPKESGDKPNPKNVEITIPMPPGPKVTSPEIPTSGNPSNGDKLNKKKCPDFVNGLLWALGILLVIGIVVGIGFGIKYFVETETITSINDIDTLNRDSMIKLIINDVSDNYYKELSLTDFPKLEVIEVRKNALQNLDVLKISNNKNLKTIIIEDYACKNAKTVIIDSILFIITIYTYIVLY